METHLSWSSNPMLLTYQLRILKVQLTKAFVDDCQLLQFYLPPDVVERERRGWVGGGGGGVIVQAAVRRYSLPPVWDNSSLRIELKQICLGVRGQGFEPCHHHSSHNTPYNTCTIPPTISIGRSKKLTKPFVG